MVLQRSSSYVVPLANFSLEEPAPLRHVVRLQEDSLLFAAGTKVSRRGARMGHGASPPAPPAHLHSVSPGVARECHRPGLPPLLDLRPLPACRALHGLRLVRGRVHAEPRVQRHLGPGQLSAHPHPCRSAAVPLAPWGPPGIGPGWVGREAEHGAVCGGTPPPQAGHGAHQEGAPRGHRVLSLPILQFHPKSAPLRGRTRLTLCGMTFRSPLDPTAHRGPPGPYRVAVGGRSCSVLLNESWAR